MKCHSLLLFAFLATNLSVSDALAWPRKLRKARAPCPCRQVQPSSTTIYTPSLRSYDDPQRIREDHQLALKYIAKMLPKNHFSKHPLDDEISRRWFDNFLNGLDSRRLIFTAEDLKRFAKHREQLDEAARAGDLSFAELVQKTYSQRLLQVNGWGQAFLDQRHDFTIDESFELRPDAFSADEAALRDRWRKR